MLRARTLFVLSHLAATSVAATLCTTAAAQTVWSGLSMNFSKAAFVNPSLPENQDCITVNVCLTRGTNQGIFNITKEAGYVDSSPADTEWATDLMTANAGKTIAATNFADLTFTNWVDAYGGKGSNQLPTRLMGRNAVVHLITDNIYLDLRFSAWSGAGGSFAYQRAVGTPTPPASTGDYNGSGVVDAADYVVWRETLDQMVSPAGAGADGNANGTVDAPDYDFWRARFGNEIVGGGGQGALAAAVPEPGSALLWITACVVLRFGCRRTRCSAVTNASRRTRRQISLATCAILPVLMASMATPASAFFHLWRFSEFFSNADGSVQFVELRVTSNGENFSQGAQIRSMSTGKVFTFPSNLDSTLTANKNLLVATPGFDSLAGGVTPDFTLPSANFFNPAGDTMTLFAGSAIDTKTFTSVPTDGLMSRVYPSNTLATNSPTNFSGMSGSVNLAASPSPSGDYNSNGQVDAADYVLWRDTLMQPATAGQGADGSGNGTIDPADYEFWRARFGNAVPGTSGVTAVPEPSTALLLGVAMTLHHFRRARRLIANQSALFLFVFLVPFVVPSLASRLPNDILLALCGAERPDAHGRHRSRY